MNCPICDKAGLEETAVSCPQCDSDLSGFALIKKIAVKQEDLESEHKQATELLHKSKVTKKVILAVSGLLVLIFVLFGFWLYTKKISVYSQRLTLAKTESDSLEHIISEKQAAINNIEAQKKDLEQQARSIKYVVRRGDNLIKLSRFFYSDEEKYREIIKENNLQDGYVLLVGDTLTIKLQH